MLTTNATGLFNVNSAGFTQGVAQDDPSTKFQLVSGHLSTSATIPLWQGIPIEELIPVSNAVGGYLGSGILQSTNLATSTGICVQNQASNGIITPQSSVPLYSSGMTVNFYRFGSGARIPMRLDPALVSLEGEIIKTQLSYDFTAKWLTTYDGTNAFPVKVLRVSTTGLVVSYNGTTGFANFENASGGNGYLALVQI